MISLSMGLRILSMGGEKRLSTHQHQHRHRHSDQIFENIVRVLSFVVFYYAEGRWFSFP